MLLEVVCDRPLGRFEDLVLVRDDPLDDDQVAPNDMLGVIEAAHGAVLTRGGRGAVDVGLDTPRPNRTVTGFAALDVSLPPIESTGKKPITSRT